MEKVMDCMALFYRMEGKDIFVEKVSNYFYFGTVLIVRNDQLRVRNCRALPSQAIECCLWGWRTSWKT